MFKITKDSQLNDRPDKIELIKNPGRPNYINDLIMICITGAVVRNTLIAGCFLPSTGLLLPCYNDQPPLPTVCPRSSDPFHIVAYTI